MEIKEIKELKSQLNRDIEKAILNLITEFKTKTDVMPQEINVKIGYETDEGELTGKDHIEEWVAVYVNTTVEI